MKAAVLYGVEDLRLEEAPQPVIASDEALVRVRVCGLCGSDINKWNGRRTTEFPFIPGHEWSGDVVGVGTQVITVRVGDRVLGETAVACGVCSACKDGFGAGVCPQTETYGISGAGRHGALAQTMAVKAKALHAVPDGMSYERAALVEPLAVSYYAIWGVGGGVAPHDRVVVFGAGPIGLLAMLTAKAAGAQVIVVQPSAFRRDLARRLGADAVIDPTTTDPVEGIMHSTGDQGATLILECSGSDQAVAASAHAVAPGGRIVLVGVTDWREVEVQVEQIQHRDAQLLGAMGFPFFFPKALTVAARKAVDVTAIITHRMPLAEIGEAFELAAHSHESGKIMIDCTQAD